MIEESYVSFETARMLKEARFDVPCFNQYTDRGTVWHCDCPENFNISQCGTTCQMICRKKKTHGFYWS